MLSEKCAEVNEDFWQELAQADPEEVSSRTGAVVQEDSYRMPFMNRELTVDLKERKIFITGAEDADPGFRVCLTALLYLLRVDTGVLGTPVSPLELSGGTMFFQKTGPHSLPNHPVEEKFGQDLAGFLAAGRSLGGEVVAAGDGALAFRVFPGLVIEVILWQADEEFPAQVSFAVSAGLDRFWHLDAVLGLIVVVVRELLAAASA